MSSPKVSILVPVYKVEAYLQRCIDSVVSQDFTDWELILVDDGSPDKCPRICDAAASKDGRIRVVHKKNGGLVSARLAGFQQSQGEWLMFLDSDDWLEAGALASLLKYTTRDLDLIRGKAQRVSQDGVVFSLESYPFEEGVVSSSEDFMYKMYIGDVAPYIWGALYKRSLFNDAIFQAGLDARVSFGEDWVVNLIAGKNIQKALYVNDVVYNYFVNPQSIVNTTVRSEEYQRRIDMALEKAGVLQMPALATVRLLKDARGMITRCFQPELPFTQEHIAKLKESLRESELMSKVKQDLPKKYLRFIDNRFLYYFYVKSYRFLFRLLKQKGGRRKVLN